jgi:hypothetical protein
MTFKEALKEVLTDMGKDLSQVGKEMGAELQRLGTQGRSEVAQALFHEAESYVPYGEGQRQPEAQQEQAVEKQPEVEMER